MKISVLVTTYGRRAYLERCISSLLSQVRRPVSVGGPRGRGAASLTGPAADGAQAFSGGAATGPNTGYSLRTDLYRYITWDDGKAGEELFDELNDPGETRNLAGSPFYAVILNDMRLRLTALRGAPAR